ncbi:diguanylate cyclase [Paenibacillaceae bacterium]|nr:diguanylate cyclase [Paenibacillaceae bacterium]
MWYEFSLFVLLLIMFGFIFLSHSITVSLKVYLSFHFLMMLWPLCQFAIDITERHDVQLLLKTVSYVSLSLLGAGWLFFSLTITGHFSVYKPGYRKVLFFMPTVVAVLLAAMNPNELYLRTAVTESGRSHGPLFWFIAVTLFFYCSLSLFYLFRALHTRTGKRQKAQIVMGITGLFIMLSFGMTELIVNVFLANSLSPINGLISIGFVLTGVYFVVAIRRYGMFNIIEVAHQDVIDSMNSGIAVLDDQDIVLATNKAFYSFVQVHVGERLQMEELLKPLHIEGDVNGFMSSYRKQPPRRAQIEACLQNSSYSHVTIYTSPIVDQYNAMIGRIITFQDVGELRKLVEASNRQNEVLQDRNRALIVMQDELFIANRKLEQMAVTDSLTGCYNRRYLMQQLEHEVITNIRYNIPFAIFLFDIDFFKSINDTYGHIVGDEVLRSTAEAVRGALRRTDILARYGGEEFTVYLPHTNRAQSMMLAERIKHVVESNKVLVGSGDETVNVTISMGVLAVGEGVSYPLEDPKAYLRELFVQADAALYEAKDGGRNRIVNTMLA